VRRRGAGHDEGHVCVRPWHVAVCSSCVPLCDLDARRVVEHTEPDAGGYRRVRDVELLGARLDGVEPLPAGDLYAAPFRR
jgi:hypothetical protein